MKFACGLAVACAITLCLNGCSTVRTGAVQGADDVPISERGFVIGSFGCNDLRFFTNYHIFFRSKDKKVDGGIHLSADGLLNTELDWSDSLWKGIAFRYSLPPGQYEFYNVRFFQNGYPATYTVSSKTDFSVPFELTRGETVYLGEIKCFRLMGQNIFGKAVPSSGYFVFSDKSQRDLPTIRRKFVDLPASEPRIGIPSVSEVHSPFIRSEPL